VFDAWVLLVAVLFFGAGFPLGLDFGLEDGLLPFDFVDLVPILE
jgi:hypothetical protein